MLLTALEPIKFFMWTVPVHVFNKTDALHLATPNLEKQWLNCACQGGTGLAFVYLHSMYLHSSCHYHHLLICFHWQRPNLVSFCGQTYMHICISIGCTQGSHCTHMVSGVVVYIARTWPKLPLISFHLSLIINSAALHSKQIVLSLIVLHYLPVCTVIQ